MIDMIGLIPDVGGSFTSNFLTFNIFSQEVQGINFGLYNTKPYLVSYINSTTNFGNFADLNKWIIDFLNKLLSIF